MNLAIIRKKRFCTFKFFIPITLTPEPKELESGVFSYTTHFLLFGHKQILVLNNALHFKIAKIATIHHLPLC